ncbi:dTDP-glucose 4,6-dehydratase [Andreprevotia lacus DSM 23236]|jgi:nucleoside-diphosphate-sugar epimerase|uniref:dTDP-glucose 4,6-dehydratase n=1 Tax=Andreprevotia lacus DSM 23236 TaxID=1121001 RepID=A0A1W1Y1X9_9NEIS|nr:NAD(P)-dependent oxidoreductase [Andreprevotia lacus]SMC29801.1 dTDP-glucose 4,6-dehydratase [Andreprevotia lacus DSM 23236]
MALNLQDPLIAADFARLLPTPGRLAALHGKTVLLTGATGFFGRWLLACCDHLQAQGVALTVVALSRDPERFLVQEPHYRQAGWLRWCRGDVQSPIMLEAGPVDYILHAATDTSADAHKHKLTIFNTVLDGGRHVLDLAAQRGCSRLLFTGSGAQYGPQRLDVARQPDDAAQACDPTQPGSAYGESKRALETLASLYAEQYGLECLFTRCFAFGGPGLSLDGHFAIGNFIRDALFRPEITVRSHTPVWRSYLYGADLAVWLLTLLVDGQAGMAYNVGSDQEILITQLAERARDLLAPGKLIVIADTANAGVGSRYVPDIARARAQGLSVWTSLDDTILNTANWARRQGAAL